MKDEDFEGVVTLGMRGNGDVSLPDGDGIELMTEIIATQRQILAEVSGKDVTTIPQVWTLYKEVQRYWDRGLRVPDDVTVVLTDDNWANIRKLPDLKNDAREGGYGLYYHFDYVGVGRNYKWVDTTSLPNMWDQLHQSAAYGNHGLWVTNVGDLKGNELPTQFFLEYAWNPDRWSLDRLPEWEEQYARQNFGEQQAEDIAEVLRRYAQLQSRRKPELLNRKITLDPAKDPAKDASAIVYDDQATPFSLTDYRELERVTEEWQQLGADAERIGRKLPVSVQDAWYELVGYEVQATANLYALREAEFKNLHYAAQGRALTNDLAAAAEARLADDLALADRFNTKVADGKWQGFQTQPHIDYGDVARYGPNAPWQQPELNNVAIKDVLFPAVKRIDLPAGAEMGVAVDGSDKWWPEESSPAVLPAFSPYQSQAAQYIEVFNRGAAPFDYRIRTGASWLVADRVRGRVDKQDRITFRVDWSRAPKGVTEVPITVSGPDGREVVVQAVVDHPKERRSQLEGFVEANGYVSIEADHYSRSVGGSGITWQRIPGIGRTGAGMEPFLVTAARQTPGRRQPAAGVPGQPVHHRAGHGARVPVAPEQRAGVRRPHVRRLLRRRRAAEGERHGGDGIRRRHHERPVGAQHLRQRQPHQYGAPHRPGRCACAEILDGRPDGGAAEPGGRHRRPQAQLPGPAGESPAEVSHGTGKGNRAMKSEIEDADGHGAILGVTPVGAGSRSG